MSLLHHYYVIITSLLRHYNIYKNCVIMRSLLHIITNSVSIFISLLPINMIITYDYIFETKQLADVAQALEAPTPLRVPNPNPFAPPKTSDWALGALGKPALRGPHTTVQTHRQFQTLTVFGHCHLPPILISRPIFLPPALARAGRPMPFGPPV
jgi:hypothetical protein